MILDQSRKTPLFAGDTTPQEHSLRERSEVDPALCWDLTDLFQDHEAFEAVFRDVEALIDEVKGYEGRLTEGHEVLEGFLKTYLESNEKAYDLYVYAHLQSDQDTANADWSAMDMRCRSLVARLHAASSWFEPALLAMDAGALDAFFEAKPAWAYLKHYVQNILRAKAHKLSAPEERILAASREVFQAGQTIFSVLDNADMRFPSIQDEKDQPIEITHGRFGKLMESKERRVRKEAFEGLYSVYDQFKNSYAATLGAQVKSINVSADLRKFGSAREAALFANRIPVAVYDALLDTVDQRIELLHRYTALRKRLLGLETLYPYDMYAPMGNLPPARYSVEEAKAIILAAMRPLGEEVQAIIQKAFDEKWMDLAENRGKRSGAYSSGSYRSKPYILMTWTGTMNDLYTLAHELGHSIHSYFSRRSQPFIYASYSIFLAEIASTTNENLLTDYLLSTEKDPAKRQAILLHYVDGFKGTVFRQTQFAKFEHEVVKAAQEGTPLTADFLSERYAAIQEQFYGPALENDAQIALEWARIPHFYYDFYVYQYATGFSAATAFASKIKKEGQKAVAPYLAFLKAGSSADPIDVLLQAGLDMRTAAPIEEALDRFGKALDALEESIA